MEEAFTRFIEDYEDDESVLTYEQAISEMVVRGDKSLVINFTHLYGFDMDLARSVLEDPENLAPVFGSVVRSKLRTRDPLFAESLNRVNVRFRSLPTDTQLRKIGSDNISHLVMVHGIIVRASSITPLVIRATFRCPVCGEMNHLEQSGQTLMKPQKCLACDNRKGFELVPKESVFIDSQKVTIQERPEDLPPGLSLGVHESRDELVDMRLETRSIDDRDLVDEVRGACALGLRVVAQACDELGQHLLVACGRLGFFGGLIDLLGHVGDV
jgi:replicative DNA helicase Mcm